MVVITVILSLAAVILAPFLAAKVMGLKGGIGKGALIAFVQAGLTQIIAMVAQHLGPMGDILGIMGGIAAWVQIVKVVHGTDTARTAVFMFWQLFFQMLLISLLFLVFGPEGVSWVWGG